MNSTRFSFDAIGTTWVIDVEARLTPPEKEKIQTQVMRIIEQFDIIYSRFREDSLINHISQKAGVYSFPPNADSLFNFYKTMYDLTNGVFTPLVGNTLSDAGYDLAYTLSQKKKLVSPPTWESIMEYHSGKLNVIHPGILDFGAAGKGYLIDLVGDLLKKLKYSIGIIDAGHDIVSFGTEKPIRVGLEHPTDTTQVIGVAEIYNRSICASAGNRRKWGSFHHIINPLTLTSPSEIIATWAVAENGLIADGISTALFLVDPQLLLQKYEFEYVIVYKDLSAKKSKSFPGELFMK